MKRIYLDHSATTPVDKKVFEAMKPYFFDTFGNSSSIHTFGQSALAGVEEARQEAARFLNCQTKEIIFTSGSTESNNLAIKGLIQALKKRGLTDMHIITSVIEHDAVLEPFIEMEKDGVKISYIPVKSNAIIDIKKLEEAIKDNTVLVSVMYVNSEVGSIQPVREIGKMIKKFNEKRFNEWKKRGGEKFGKRPQPIYFHTDATQAANFLRCDVEWNYIDLLSLSGHKIYGPKGVGLLYKRQGVPLEAIQRGGHHENNMRSGTLNVPGIVGMGAALRLLDKKSQERNNKQIAKLRDYLVSGLSKKIKNIKLNTDRENSTPSHAHFSFFGVEGESALIALDLEGIAVSTGSACASNSLKASHVLVAMGIRVEDAHCSIRFTLGKHTTKEELNIVIKVLPPIIERLRKMNPIYNE